MSSSLLYCSFCLFVKPPEDQREFFDTQRVTVMNGQAVCLYHARMFPAGGEWRDMYDAITRRAQPDALPQTP